MRRHTTSGRQRLDHYARLLRDAQARLAGLAFKDVSARIAAVLLRFGGGDGQPVRFSHQDIAEMVGSSRESVSRALEEMRAAGLIDFGGAGLMPPPAIDRRWTSRR